MPAMEWWCDCKCALTVESLSNHPSASSAPRLSFPPTSGAYSSSPLRSPRAMNLRTVPAATSGCWGASSPCLSLKRGISVNDRGRLHTQDATPLSRSLPASRAARRARSGAVKTDPAVEVSRCAASSMTEYTGACGRLGGENACTPCGEPAQERPEGAGGRR